MLQAFLPSNHSLNQSLNQISYQVLSVYRVKAVSALLSLQFGEVNKGVPQSRKWRRVGYVLWGSEKLLFPLVVRECLWRAGL